MPSATVTVSSVQRVEGVSKKTGKPYTKFVVHADGQEFSTFDGALANMVNTSLVGKRAEVTYNQGTFGFDLVAAAAVDGVAPASDFAAPPAVTPQGDTDWDLIGLRKTRCLLWAHFLGSDMAKAIVEAADDGKGKAEAVGRVGSRLVELAESDIFHRPPAEKDAGIPF